MTSESKTVGRWRLTVERSTGGGLFELEERVRFSIHDRNSGALILAFRGSVDFDYAPPDWEPAGSTGVVDVELHEGFALVHAGGPPVRYLLPPRAVSNDEIDALLGRFGPLNAAIEKYNYELAWSSDVAIPADAIEASRLSMWARWRELGELFDQLGLKDMAYHNLRWPRRVRGGRAKIARLVAWMERDRHLAAEPLP